MVPLTTTARFLRVGNAFGANPPSECSLGTSPRNAAMCERANRDQSPDLDARPKMLSVQTLCRRTT